MLGVLYTNKHTHTHIYTFHTSVCMLSHVHLFATPKTVAHQVPLCMEFCRKEYQSGLLFHTPGDISNPVIKPVSFVPPSLARRFFPTAPHGKTIYIYIYINHILNAANWVNDESIYIHIHNIYLCAYMPHFKCHKLIFNIKT